MQPRERQTPPGFNSGSISVTVMPRSAARNAAAYPPGPPPITAMLRDGVSDMNEKCSFVETLLATSLLAAPLILGSSLSPAETQQAGSLRSISCDDAELTLPLHRQQERLLKRLRDPSHEPRRIGAVNQPMIV